MLSGCAAIGMVWFDSIKLTNGFGLASASAIIRRLSPSLAFVSFGGGDVNTGAPETEFNSGSVLIRYLTRKYFRINIAMIST